MAVAARSTGVEREVGTTWVWLIRPHLLSGDGEAALPPCYPIVGARTIPDDDAKWVDREIAG